MSFLLRGSQVLISLLALGSACGAADYPGPVHIIRVPNGGLQPQATADPEGVVHVVFLKGEPKGCDVFYARRNAERTDFGQPIRVNSAPASAIAIGTVRGAQFALGSEGQVHVVWNGAQPAHEPGAKGAAVRKARQHPSEV